MLGTLLNEVQINLADGANITIQDASINAAGDLRTLESAGITCLGDATITLSGTNVIKGFHTFYPGIFVPEGYTLTIQGDGSLDVSASASPYGIGGAIGSIVNVANCGNVVILGGVITASPGNRSAAIGSGYAGTCGDITIGGTADITVTGGSWSAALGSGAGPYEAMSICGDITIGGHAKVTATGSPNAAAIGSGLSSKCGNIMIGDDAEVVAYGIDCGPGIGAGDISDCKAITITGGRIIATCDDYGPGIGSAFEGSCESITITGGTVLAVGGEDGPGIGSGPESEFGVPVVITSGTTEVTVIRGSDKADFIGTGVDGTRGSVTIDGVENATPESTFPHFDASVIQNRWTILNKNAIH